MALRRSDERGDDVAGLTRAQVLDLCARFASYAEAGSMAKELLARAGADAVRRFADDTDVLVAVGRMYLMAEELVEAERALRRATRLAPRDPHAQRLFGEVILRRGDPAAAHTALSAAVASGMNDPWTKTWVARALDYAELLPDLGADGVARDVRQVLGKPGQGPPEAERRLEPQQRSSDPPARVYSRNALVGKIDKGIFFAGDPRAELPDFRQGRWGLRPEDVVDLPTPSPGGVSHASLGIAARESAARARAAGAGDAAPGAIAEALGEDAAWDRPPSSDATPPSDSLPASDTEVSAWVPELEHLRDRSATPVGEARRSAPPPVQVQRVPRGAEPPAPPGDARGGRLAPAPPPLPRLSANELFDEFTEHKRPRKDLPLPPGVSAVQPVAPSPATAPITAEKPRRGPPPLPPEPARASPPPLPPEPARAEPSALPAEPATALSVPMPVRGVRAGAPMITILGADEPGPVTAPPSALIPLDPGPVTAPPSALIPLDPGPVTAPPSALLPLDAPGAMSSLRSPSRDAAPPSAMLPPEPPSLQIPSALLLDRSPEAVPPAAAAAPGGAAAAKAPPKKQRSRLQVVLLRALAAAAVVAVLAGSFQLYKRNRATKIRAFSAQASTALQVGGPRGVADAEAALSGARRIDPRNRGVALATVKVRFFAVIDVDEGRVPELVSAIEEAASAGVRSSEMAFAQVARAAASNDTASAVEIIAHHDEDPDRANDPLYQLAAGVASEPQDAAGAIERYRAAVKLDPQLFSAHLRLVRALSFAGQAKAAKEMLAALRDRWSARPELTALAAIVVAAEVGGAAAETLDLDTDSDMLPRPLRAAARALAKGGGEQVIAKATSEADIAPIVVLCGELAMRSGHEASAREAAHRAIEITSSYAPAYALAARVALVSGRFEEARQAALRAPADVAAEVLALLAYEAGDVAAMTAAAGRRADEPDGGAVAAGRARLRAIEPMSPAVIKALASSGALWADVVAMDAALDAGDLDLAHSLSAAWTDAEKHPIRATRIARLRRYQGKNGLAQAAAASAVPTTAARVEGALAAAEMASARIAAANTMQAGRTDEERWVAVFLLAREGRDGPARTLMRTLAFPAAEAPLLLRTVAALALGELHIKRPTDPTLVSLEVWTKNPDVARALGVRLPRPGESAAPGDPPKKPALFGKIPRPNEEPY